MNPGSRPSTPNFVTKLRGWAFFEWKGGASFLGPAFLVLMGCVHESSESRPQDIEKLEKRIANLEAASAPSVKQQPPPPRPEGPVAARAAKLRAAADLLEKADDAKRQGDSAQAQSLFREASAKAGPAAVAELEPLFRPPAPEPATETSPTKPGESVSKSRPRASREKASLEGTTLLSGPFASSGGMGAVMLAPLFAKVAAQPRHIVMDQRNRMFSPHVLPAPVGSTVSFPNGDPVYHNIFSVSETKSFDLGVYKDGQSRDVVFDRPGVVRVLCNLHATMGAYVVVHEEPYSTAIDSSGRFSIKELNPGKYRLRAWHERAKQWVTREVALEPGSNRVQLQITADAAPSLGPNKYGKPRDRDTDTEPPQPY